MEVKKKGEGKGVEDSSSGVESELELEGEETS